MPRQDAVLRKLKSFTTHEQTMFYNLLNEILSDVVPASN
jgi:hypothetical protein